MYAYSHGVAGASMRLVDSVGKVRVFRTVAGRRVLSLP